MKPGSLILAAAAFSLNCHADIYKSVGPDGNVRYQDRPDEHAEKFVPPSLNAVPMPKWEPEARSVEEQQSPLTYSDFDIAEPADRYTAESANGELVVRLRLEPELKQEHGIDLLVDGIAVVVNSRSLEHRLQDIERGEHALQARITDSHGRPLQHSSTLQIFMKRHSSLQRTPQVGPRDADGDVYRPGPRHPSWQPAR